MMSETTFAAYLCAALNAPGRATRVWRQNAGQWKTEKGHFVHGAPAGAADLTGIVSPSGVRLEVETKSPTAKNRPSQDTWAQLVIKIRGGIYVRVRQARGEELKAAVERCVREVDEAIAKHEEIS